MPVSAKPILPCHSVIQGPAGKFMSKMLKGIVKTKQGIIHGSKDLALKLHSVVATTRRNGTRDMLTSAKLSNGLSSSGVYKRTRQGALAAFIYYIYTWLLVRATTISIRPLSPCRYLMSITHPHVFSLRPPCFLHVPWHHTFNLRYTYAHHVYTMRNPCPLTSLLTLTPTLDSSRSF